MLAESFERIHRSNLVGMGILPLVFQNGQNAEFLGLKGDETFDIEGITTDLKPRSTLHRQSRPARPARNSRFTATVALNTDIEVNYYRNGGILHTVLRNLVS